MIGFNMPKINPKFLYYVLGVLVTTGANMAPLLIERRKVTLRMKRSEAFLSEMERLHEEYRQVDENDRERQNEISEQIVALMKQYDL